MSLPPLPKELYDFINAEEAKDKKKAKAKLDAEIKAIEAKHKKQKAKRK